MDEDLWIAYKSAESAHENRVSIGRCTPRDLEGVIHEKTFSSFPIFDVMRHVFIWLRVCAGSNSRDRAGDCGARICEIPTL